MNNKKYHYCAKNSFGELVSGEIEGQSPTEVSLLLAQRNLILLDLAEQNLLVEWIKKERSFGKPSFLTISQFAKDLSILLKAGIVISEALEIIQNQLGDRKFSRDIDKVAEKIRSGESLSLAMEERKASFPPLFIFFIKTGELGGNLGEMLDFAADYYQRIDENRQKLKEILFYPLLLMVVSMGVIVFLLIVVLPQFVQLFSAIEKNLPGPTIFLLDASRCLRDYGIFILSALVFFPVLFTFFKEEPLIKKTIEKVRIPLYSKLRRWEFLMMISKSMGMLLNSGVDLLTVMSGLEAATVNGFFKEALVRVKKSVSEGLSLSEAMEESGVFLDTFIQFTKVGEATGKIGEMMILNSEFYKSQYDHLVNLLKTIIEPLLILILGMIILFILVAIMLPVFDLYLFYSNI